MTPLWYVSRLFWWEVRHLVGAAQDYRQGRDRGGVGPLDDWQVVSWGGAYHLYGVAAVRGEPRVITDTLLGVAPERGEVFGALGWIQLGRPADPIADLRAWLGSIRPDVDELREVLLRPPQ